MRVLFNPRCTKCRVLRKAFNEREVDWEQILYLQDGLDRALVEQIFEGYAGDWRDLIRTKETVFREAGVKIRDLEKEQAMQMVLEHPVLMQRPIVLKDREVIIARDDESIKTAMR